MGKLVTPKVHLVGYSVLDTSGLEAYLRETGNEDFLDTVAEAKASGMSDAEVMVSLYAKLCYKSLTLGKNANVTRIRDIGDNLIATHSQGHGSVWEHCSVNFIVTDCSRVYTHEQVRHRVGVAYSQTSGRYVRGDSVDVVFDPILEPVRHVVEELQAEIERQYRFMVELMGLDDMQDFDRKKKITSALRRLLPNGQSNEMGMTINLRGLRHIVQLRTSRHAEWEIRAIYAQVYQLVLDRFPLVFHGATVQVVDGILEISGMKTQPY